MESILTYNIKLQFNSQTDKSALLDVLNCHKDVWNEISKWMFNTGNLNKKVVHDKCYKKSRKIFKAPSQIVIRAINSICSTYQSIKSNGNLYKIQEAPILKNLSIRLDKRLYDFISDTEIRLTTRGKRIDCHFKPYQKFTELFKKYTLCDPLIFVKDQQVWLSCSFNVPAPTHVENTILGIDLGLRRFITTSEGNTIHPKELLQKKRKIRHNKDILKSKVKTTRSHSARTKLKKFKKKQKNLNKQICHLTSNQILKTKSNTIILEDLSGLKKNKLNKKKKDGKVNKEALKTSKSSKNRLSQVPFGGLLNILTYKALLKGKKVETVNPYNTSKTDFRKGKANGIRKGCRYYTVDGCIFDADWNAAINIALKYQSKRPISYNHPYDGGLNLKGRGLSELQSSQHLDEHQFRQM